MTAHPAMTVNEAAYLEAKRWIGTPFRHQGRCFGAGADCLGLVLGVARNLGQPTIATPTDYPPDWHMLTADERLWRGLQTQFRERSVFETAERGDVLLFRLHRRNAASHLAIFGETGLIQALSRLGVVQTPFSMAWRRRLVARFAWPSGA